MDRGKRALDWPPTADERKTKKPCCAYDPPTTTGGGSGAVPEISSLLSSLSVAKRHRPSAADDHHALKRPRHQLQLDAQAQILHAPMRGLEICCDETDMSSNSIRPPHSDDADWSSFLPELLRLICRRLPLAVVPGATTWSQNPIDNLLGLRARLCCSMFGFSSAVLRRPHRMI